MVVQAGARAKDMAPPVPVAPPAPGVTLLTSNVGGNIKAPPAFHEVRVRFLLLIDNKVKL